MASIEGIGSPFFKQRSERSPNPHTHQSSFLLNDGMDVITFLREREKLLFAGNRFARYMFFVLADLSDRKTGSYGTIRECMKPIPR